MTNTTDLLGRLELCYDAIPRDDNAQAIDLGPFVLFVRQGAGWPYYARPRLGTGPVTPDEVTAVFDHQASLGVPQAIEWVDDVTPALLPAVRTLGLDVHLAPLMVLDPALLPERSPAGATVSLVDPSAPDFPETVALSSAVAHLAFGAGGTDIGAGGPAERDAAVTPFPPEMLEYLAAGLRRGRRAEAIATTAAEGIVARGAYQSVDAVTEIVGVATLPAARRRGLGAAVSATLARHALDHGSELVFLAAADEAVARVYGRIGFRQVGTACILEAPTP